jgi:tetratricopeptide (TPR) repeat protein
VRLSDLHWIDAFASRERAIDELVKPKYDRPVEPERPAPDRGLSPEAGATKSVHGAKAPPSRAILTAATAFALIAVAAAGAHFLLGQGGQKTVELAGRVAAALRDATAAFQRKDFKTSTAAYSAALDLAPQSVEALIGRLRVYPEIKDYPHSIEDETWAIERAPGNAEAYLLRAQDLPTPCRKPWRMRSMREPTSRRRSASIPRMPKATFILEFRTPMERRIPRGANGQALSMRIRRRLNSAPISPNHISFVDSPISRD